MPLNTHLTEGRDCNYRTLLFRGSVAVMHTCTTRSSSSTLRRATTRCDVPEEAPRGREPATDYKALSVRNGDGAACYSARLSLSQTEQWIHKWVAYGYTSPP